MTIDLEVFNPGYYVTKLSNEAGMDPGLFKQLVCLFISFPFAFLLRYLPKNNKFMKNIYVISVASFYLFGVLNIFNGFVTLLVAALGTFVITKYIKHPSMPWINFVFCVGHLCMNHLAAQFFIDDVYDPNKIDITGAQMVLVIKLTSFAWNIHDGRFKSQELNSYQISKTIVEFPKLIDFISYTFFFPSLLTGPSIDFKDYNNFLNDKFGSSSKRPSNYKVVIIKFLQGIFFAVLFLQLDSRFSADDIYTPRYLNLNVLYKLGYLYILGFYYRSKYYTAWSISESACILSGLGYNGIDKKTNKPLWNGIQNIDPLGFELGQNAHVCLEAWNMNTNKWLKNAVYLRVKKKNKKPGFKLTLFTFLISAFWHGIKPGYYFSFIIVAFFQTCMKIYRRNIRPIFLKNSYSKFFYDVLSWVVTQLSFGFMVQPFVLLEFSKLVYCWSTVYFIPIVGIFLTFFIFKGPFSSKVIKFLKLHHATDEQKAIVDPAFSSKPAATISEKSVEEKMPVYEKVISDIKNDRLRKIIEDKKNYEEFEQAIPELSTEEIQNTYNDISDDINQLKRTNTILYGENILKDALVEIQKDIKGDEKKD